MTQTLTAPETERTPAPDVSPKRAPSDNIPVKSNRLVSLDAYRGFVMLLMASDGLLISHVVRRNHLTGGIWPLLAHHTDHVEWRGCSLWDLIQPSFTFIVGVALPFSLAKRRSRGQSFGWLTAHAVWRSLLLIALGVFLRSLGRPRTYYTFEDTLSQIGLGYTFVFMLAWVRPRWQVLAAAGLLLGYWAAFALYPLPPAGFDYATVGVSPEWHSVYGLHGFAAHWDKNTNLAAAFDHWFLNLFPREGRFEFNGGGYLTLSFIPTLATMVLGLLVGELMRSRTRAAFKVLILLAAGAAGLAAGQVCDATGVCPVVKRIWTPSWTLYSAGWACLLLAGFYTVIDWAGLKRWAFPLVVVGMNSIAMYCLADGGGRQFIRDAFHTHLGPYHVFDRVAGIYSPILEFSLCLVLLWMICWWMYRRNIFLRI